jgi:hypothetical protein
MVVRDATLKEQSKSLAPCGRFRIFFVTESFANGRGIRNPVLVAMAFLLVILVV